MDIIHSQRSVTVRSEMSGISQETLTIIGATIALAALMLTNTAGVRGEIQALRDELRAEVRGVRTEARADRGALRAEAHADREAMRAEHETFQSHILRLTEQQGVLSARLDGLRDPSATNR